MSDYKAPLRDMRFVLNEVFEVSRRWATLPGLTEVIDVETAAAILEEAAMSTRSKDDFYVSKLATARFYFARVLPRIHSLSASVKAGSECLYQLDAAQF